MGRTRFAVLSLALVAIAAAPPAQASEHRPPTHDTAAAPPLAVSQQTPDTVTLSSFNPYHVLTLQANADTAVQLALLDSAPARRVVVHSHTAAPTLADRAPVTLARPPAGGYMVSTAQFTDSLPLVPYGRQSEPEYRARQRTGRSTPARNRYPS